MANARLPRHGHTHARGGPDEIGTGIYISEFVVADPVDHVLFDAFPANLVRLELAWRVRLDGGGEDPGLDYLLGILMNGDAEANEVGHDETEYHWNVGIPNDAHDPSGSIVSISDDTFFNDYGGLSWIPRSAECYGVIVFPDYAAALEDTDHACAWHGHGAAGNGMAGDSTNPFVCSGSKQEDTPMTAIALLATQTDDSSSRQNFASGSRFTLTGY